MNRPLSPLLQRLAVLGIRHAAFDCALGHAPEGVQVAYVQAATGRIQVQGLVDRALLTRLLHALDVAEAIPLPADAEHPQPHIHPMTRSL
jgi:hypothetical protein